MNRIFFSIYSMVFKRKKAFVKKSINKKQTGQIMSLKKRVKAIENNEPKLFTNSAFIADGTEIDDSTVSNVDLCAALGQGDTTATRDGNIIYLDRIKLQFQITDGMTSASSNIYQRVRVMVIEMLTTSATYGSSSFPTVFSEWTPQQRSLVGKIYWDRFITVGSPIYTAGALVSAGDNKRIVTVRKTINLRGKKVEYVTGASTTVKGSVMIALFSNIDAGASTSPTISNANAFVYFHDN